MIFSRTRIVPFVCPLRLCEPFSQTCINCKHSHVWIVSSDHEVTSYICDRYNVNEYHEECLRELGCNMAIIDKLNQIDNDREKEY